MLHCESCRNQENVWDKKTVSLFCCITLKHCESINGFTLSYNFELYNSIWSIWETIDAGLNLDFKPFCLSDFCPTLDKENTTWTLTLTCMSRTQIYWCVHNHVPMNVASSVEPELTSQRPPTSMFVDTKTGCWMFISICKVKIHKLKDQLESKHHVSLWNMPAWMI